MSLSSKFKPPAQAYELDAFMAPAHWFFCRRIEIPSELEPGEEEGFALLELEALSPFPLEHLHFGYCLDDAGRFALVFAAYKRRFEKVDSSDWRRIDAVLPDFLIGLHSEAKQDGGLILVTEAALAAFSYDGLSSLPSAFYAEGRVPPAEGEDAVRREREQLDAFGKRAGDRLGLDRSVVWYADHGTRWEGKTAWFGAADASGASVARLGFTRDQIWKADLRDPEQVELAKRDERQNAFLWKSLGGWVACACLLLLGELYWGANVAYLALRESAIAEREPLVREIDELQLTSNSLRDFQESNLTPFEMIEALYPFQKYPNIIYRKFETAGPDTLIIDAKAANQTQVTEFKKRLEQFDKVDSVALSKQVNNPSGSTFTTTIRFKYGAFHEVLGLSSNG